MTINWKIRIFRKIFHGNGKSSFIPRRVRRNFITVIQKGTEIVQKSQIHSIIQYWLVS